MNQSTGRLVPVKHAIDVRFVGVAALTGGCAGLVAVAYRYALSYSEKLCSFMFSLANTPAMVMGLFVILALLGACAGLFSQIEPLIKGSGIPQVEAQLLGHIRPNWLRVMLLKFIGGALCIIGGLSLGREGPSIQLGAMAAQGLGKRLGSSREDSKYLLVCGACAGLSAAFNAPLAGIMFGLEEIHKNFSPRAFFSCTVAAICADIVSKAFVGMQSTLSIAPISMMPLPYYGLAVVLGVILGLFGAFYNKTLLWLQRQYNRINPPWVRVVIPFMIAGVLGFVMPQVLGGGHGVIGSLVNGEYALWFMLAVLAVKFAFSMISFSSGAPGGIFFPMLVLGALIGGIFGGIAVPILGMSEARVINFILMGMAGVFAAIVRAPLTGILLVVEMSGSVTQLIGLGIVAGTAALVAGALKSAPIYESLLQNMVPASTDGAHSNSDPNIIDIPVTYSSPLGGRIISEIDCPEDALIVAVTRSGESLIPHGSTAIQPGDLLSVLCSAGDEEIVRKWFEKE